MRFAGANQALSSWVLAMISTFLKEPKSQSYSNQSICLPSLNATCRRGEPDTKTLHVDWQGNGAQMHKAAQIWGVAVIAKRSGCQGLLWQISWVEHLSMIKNIRFFSPGKTRAAWCIFSFVLWISARCFLPTDFRMFQGSSWLLDFCNSRCDLLWDGTAIVCPHCRSSLSDSILQAIQCNAAEVRLRDTELEHLTVPEHVRSGNSFVVWIKVSELLSPSQPAPQTLLVNQAHTMKLWINLVWGFWFLFSFLFLLSVWGFPESLVGKITDILCSVYQSLCSSASLLKAGFQTLWCG